jgi:hypothetical protein
MKKTDIDTPKDIEQLLQRFMDGLTSVEEEHRLGHYFRHADVPEEWSAYKEMFAYFDEGMPQGRYNTPEQRPRDRRVALWAGLAAAAAVALTIVITLPKHSTSMPSVGEAVAVATPDTTLTEPGEAVNDSTDTQSGHAKQPQHRSFYKHKYEPAPPKTYYAEATPATDKAQKDEAERLVAEQLNMIELTQQAMMMHVNATAQAQNMQALLATNDDIDDLQESN